MPLLSPEPPCVRDPRLRACRSSSSPGSWRGPTACSARCSPPPPGWARSPSPGPGSPVPAGCCWSVRGGCRAPAWRRIAVTAALAAQVQPGYFGAVALTSVGLATLVGAAPVLPAERVLGRPGSRRTVMACGLAGPGLALPVGWSGGGQVLPGAGLALLAAAGFAGLTLLGARAGFEDRGRGPGPGPRDRRCGAARRGRRDGRDRVRPDARVVVFTRLSTAPV